MTSVVVAVVVVGPSSAPSEPPLVDAASKHNTTIIEQVELSWL